MIRTQKTALCVVVLLMFTIALGGCKKSAPDAQPDSSKGSTGGSATFQAGFKIAADSKPINIEVGHLVPDVVDWNNDGKKDLLVGQFKDGAIHLYLNQGTDATPVFKDFTLLAAGDKPIKLDAG